MKRDISTGSQNFAAPVTSVYLGSQYVTRVTISHGLGIVPFFSLHYEPFADGVVWEALGSRSQGRVQNPRIPANYGPYLIGWADTSNIYIELGYIANTLTGTFPVYYTIYRDYGIS